MLEFPLDFEQQYQQQQFLQLQQNQQQQQQQQPQQQPLVFMGNFLLNNNNNNYMKNINNNDTNLINNNNNNNNNNNFEGVSNINPMFHQIQGNGNEITINAQKEMNLLINYDNDKKTKEKVKKQPTAQDINKKEAKCIELFQKHIDKLRTDDNTLSMSAVEIVDEYRNKQTDKESFLKTIIARYQPSISTCKVLFNVGRMKSLHLGRDKDKKTLPVIGSFEDKDFKTKEWKSFVKAITEISEYDPKEVYRKYYSYETLDERYKYIQHLRRKYNVSSKTCCKIFHFRKENWKKILNHT